MKSTYTQWQRTVAGVIFSFFVLAAGPGYAQDDLDFFKNYFITGGHESAGVGLRNSGNNGLATGTINMTGVPAGAEVLAAFLYWQVVSKTNPGPDSGVEGATFKGIPLTTPTGLSAPDGPIARVLDDQGTAPCWSSGGGTGNSGGSHRTYTYRADVLRFLAVDNAGRHIANGPHQVQLPDGGNGNSVPIALGASLLIVYRHPVASTPLTAVVIYDGGYTLNNQNPQMVLTVEGFYDPFSGSGRMTHIVGSGQGNKSETLQLPGRVIPNAFPAAQGASWDDRTDNTSGVTGDSATTTTTGNDCLTWAAVVYETRVNDTDDDGLLDAWERPGPTLHDPNGVALPDLNAMGADFRHKDMFVEIGYMDTPGATSYGGVVEQQHSHLPDYAALEQVGDAFKNAPVPNPVGGPGIDVHFDVGNHYQGQEYIISSGLARGGLAINENITVCSPGGEPWICQFSAYPGTVGWKSGFRFLRDSFLNTPLPNDGCDTPGNDGSGQPCERVFDQNRKHSFRYGLFVHALGVPQETCIGNDGFPDFSCQDNDPLFHVPVTNTGVGDFPGGDFMVSLGSFKNISALPVGTPFFQAGTTMHELGHTLGLSHRGDQRFPACAPNYLSSMNYLFQLRGLKNGTDPPSVDFSRHTTTMAINESGLSDPRNLMFPPDVPDQTAWYAPWDTDGDGNPDGLAAVLGVAPAPRHCDGSLIGGGEDPMFRLDGPSSAIDWDGDPLVSVGSQDVNFDGVLENLGKGAIDWDIIRLNQVAARRNAGGWFVADPPPSLGVYLGPMSLDTGRGDLGRGDLGRGDLGRGDLGRGDLGRGDLGRGDLGRGDLGRGDLGRGDLGRGDLGRGDLGRGDLGRGDLGTDDQDDAFEVNDLVAAGAGNAPPNSVVATIIDDPEGPGPCFNLPDSQCTAKRVQIDWSANSVGSADEFVVKGVAGTEVTPTSQLVFGLPGDDNTVDFVVGQADYSLVVNVELPGGDNTFWVFVEFEDGTTSAPAFVTVDFPNVAPSTVVDSYETDTDTELVVGDVSGLLVNDSDVDSVGVSVALLVEPSNGTLTLLSDGSLTYQPDPGFIGEDAFTYQAFSDADPDNLSAPTMVTVRVGPPPYGFVNVQNLPPNGSRGFNSGSAVPLTFQLTLDGVVVDSSDADPVFTITGPAGDVILLDPGSSDLRYQAGDDKWTVNWQTQDEGGADLPAGTYDVKITINKTGQTFPLEGEEAIEIGLR